MPDSPTFYSEIIHSMTVKVLRPLENVGETLRGAQRLERSSERMRILSSTNRDTTASRARALLGGCPRPARAELYVVPYQASHDLRRCQILFCTQTLKQLLLPGVNQNGKPGGTIFRSQIGLTLCDKSICIRL